MAYTDAKAPGIISHVNYGKGEKKIMSKGTLNKVILIGRVGADPEVRYMPSGNAVTNIRLATNDGYKDKNTGQFVESTEWHRVVLFNKLGEIAGQYLQKGRLVYIEGRIRTSKWQDQAGQDRYTTEIIANEMQLLGGSGREDQSHGQEVEESCSKTAPAVASSSGRGAAVAAAPEFESKFEDDDIPF